MGESPRRLLLADATEASRATLASLAREDGWEIVAVDSGLQVLRALRAAKVDLVLIDPDLPGTGVTGADVARTLKGATEFRHLPVLFLLHGDRTVPADIPVDGAIALDGSDPARVLATIRQTIGLPDARRATSPETAAPGPAPEAPAAAPGEALLQALTDLIERLAVRLEALLSQRLADLEEGARAAARAQASVEARELLAKEGPELVRQEVEDRVREIVERVGGEVARGIVADVAERLIAEEIARLRRQYGIE
jgi:CheY-like chemotaxis protein